MKKLKLVIPRGLLDELKAMSPDQRREFWERAGAKFPERWIGFGPRPLVCGDAKLHAWQRTGTGDWDFTCKRCGSMPNYKTAIELRKRFGLSDPRYVAAAKQGVKS